MALASQAPFGARTWRLGHGREIKLGPEAVIMGIVNVTPDSFSDGGLLADADAAVAAAIAMAGEGAAIVDIGGESTRPGAEPVAADEEQRRVLPVIERLARESDVLIAIDTYRAETARLAISAGAHIVNDVSGLRRDSDMAGIVAETGAGVCIMHTGRGREKLPNVIEDQAAFLGESLEIAKAAGIAGEAIVLDPGFGFAKETDENLDLMARFGELHSLGYPLLAGTSRKRFVGAISGREAASERDAATAATSVVLRLAGAAVFRVHNVAINRDALAVADAMVAQNPMGPGATS